jgi:hypothetical protein
LTGDVKQFRNYCDLTKIARCGFSWRKTTKRSIASAYTNCETALAVRARNAAERSSQELLSCVTDTKESNTCQKNGRRGT